MVESKQIPKGFKNTDVGIIPNDWHIQKLNSLVCNHNAGVYKKKELYGKGCNIVGVSNLYDIDYVDGQEFGCVPLSEQELKQYLLNGNDLLYSESSLVREGIARTVYVTKEGSHTAFAWHTRRYSINQKVLLSKYLYYYLQTRPARKYMMDKSIQSALTGINTTEYFACPIPIPSLTEQTAIAKVLFDTDELITKLEKLIAKKRAIKQGAMQELLKPKEGWVEKTLGDVGEVKMCRRVFNHETQSDGTIPFFKIGTFGKEPDAYISEDLYNSYRKRFSFPKKGDILISAAGTIGRTLIYNGQPAYFQDSNIVWIDNCESLISNNFLYYVYKIIKYNTEGGTIQRLYNSILKSAKFLCPDSKMEQNRIAQILSDMDLEIESLEKKLEKYKLLKQGMMQNLLTGKIRLI
ncbi:MAG: restriction endonuclease subunit S [Ignavibacteria bacterium]